MRAVLFDLDDTITNRLATVRAYAPRFIADFGASFRLTDPVVTAAEIARIDHNGYNHQRAADLAAHEAWIASPGAAALADHWFTHFPACTQAREGLRTTLDALEQRGLRLGVVTNGPTQLQRSKVAALALQTRMGAVLISDEVGVAKPDARIFLAAAARLGVEPSECMFVGDNPEKDVVGAAAVGMRAIWLPAALPWPPGIPGPRERIGALPELLTLLERVAPHRSRP